MKAEEIAENHAGMDKYLNEIYEQGFKDGADSKLQALKEELQHDGFELDEAAEEYATEASKKYKTASVFKDGALWMLHYIKTNLITNLEDNE